MSSLSLEFVGVAAARPWPGRPSAAALVSCLTTRVLIDCGEGTLLHLPGSLLGNKGLDAVLITHLHGDHCYGLPSLLTSMNLAGRSRTLCLIGPESLEAYVRHNLEMTHAQLKFALSYVSLDSSVDQTRVLFERGALTVRAIPLRHRVPAFGYGLSSKSSGRRIRPQVLERLQIPYTYVPQLRQGHDYTDAAGRLHANEALTLPGDPARHLVYFTDTAPLPDYPAAWPAPDVLVHEATFADEDAALARTTGHSTVSEAAAFAKTCHARRLLLTHRSIRYAEPERLLAQAKRIFAEVSWAEAGQRV